MSRSGALHRGRRGRRALPGDTGYEWTMRSLLADLADEWIPTAIPVLVGAGVPLLRPAARTRSAAPVVHSESKPGGRERAASRYSSEPARHPPEESPDTAEQGAG